MAIGGVEGRGDRLRAEAVVLARRATEARDLAVALDRRRVALGSRLEPVRRRHREEIWSSAAAEWSRAVLHRVIAREIWQAGEHLLETAGALRRRADALDDAAAQARRRAEELDQAGIGELAEELDPAGIGVLGAGRVDQAGSGVR